MKRTQPIRGVLSGALLVAVLVVLALPGAAAAGKLAEATVHAGGVDFLPGVAFSAARVTVTGPELVYQRSFAAGERLSVDLFDPEGRLLPDGTYTWSLQLTPTAAKARELRRAAERNEGVAPDAWLAETGSFAVRSGLVVDGGLGEGGPARPVAADSGPARDLGAPAAGDRTRNDDDAAVTAGARERRQQASPSANRDRADAEALAAGPAPERAVIEEQPIRQRSYPTDGRNGRN